MEPARKPETQRFHDPQVRLGHFLGEILVHCPRCDGRASVLPVSRTADDRPTAWTRRSVTCLACSYTAHVPRSENGRMTIRLGGCGDAYFGLPLWLSTECRGRVLWAYNAAHLDLLEAFVSAKLRERDAVPGSMSMIARLPAWVKDAKHRGDVMRAIQRLRAMAT
jgi:hypothetical protein